MNNVYYKILNEIASAFDMDQWDEQVNLFTDTIKENLTGYFIYIVDPKVLYTRKSEFNPKYDKHNIIDLFHISWADIEKAIKKDKKWKNEYSKMIDVWFIEELDGTAREVFINGKKKVNDFTTYLPEADGLIYTSLDEIPEIPGKCELYIKWINLEKYLNIVESAKNLFKNCKALKDVPYIDTKNVKNMESMFEGCINLINMPMLNMSKCKNKKNIFKNCSF